MSTDRPLEGRIIPAGAPLPAADDEPPPPPPRAPGWSAPPGADNLPPWRTPVPVPVGPPPPQEIVHVHHVHHVHVTLADPDPGPPPRWSWDWWAAALRRWARPRQLLVALPASLPVAVVWSSIVSSCRDEAGAPAGYAIAIGPLIYLLAADARSHRLTIRIALISALAGLGAVFSPFDIVTAFTGVTQ